LLKLEAEIDGNSRKPEVTSRIYLQKLETEIDGKSWKQKLVAGERAENSF
jgi:hypothetical protein